MKRWWWNFPGLFSPEVCQHVIKTGLTYNAQDGLVNPEKGSPGKNQQEIRRSTVRWLNRHDTRLEYFFKVLDQCVVDSNINCFDFDLSGYRELQFTEYNGDKEQKDHYDWHQDRLFDANDGTAQVRKLSLVVQLSDPKDYEGGDLHFQSPAVDLHKDAFIRQGSVVLFPSFTYHKVMPVTSGKRFSFVTWVCGPRWR